MKGAHHRSVSQTHGDRPQINMNVEEFGSDNVQKSSGKCSQKRWIYHQEGELLLIVQINTNYEFL